MKVAEQHLPLLQQAQTGDPAALAEILRLCQPDIRRYAKRHCLVSDIDDAVQEALLILSRHIGSLRALAALSGWLFRVVERECRRLGRKALRFDPYDEEKLDHWLGSHSREGLRMELASALESLPADYRQIILLRDFEELTVRELAERLGISQAAAKSRLHRARTMAREYLLG
ncbi:RNA polymerase subunit sigma-24 [Cupriavidus sp. USMAA2-4]|uniref:RNA polymerase subunit sigma-24 n=1 Tax=Cupriavidus malaysiensis TaxID=367825 RepID=A0ABN4TNB4_9BURK|nr:MULTISPECIES: sigma-70 family RNA polymerase sigma factor [Cupriavidus]AOY93786.1 RNA polymerase subunit sigma-24 [Cupriavidus sp. USMAA2-4]AOZ06550.1 RNA polymerase subunit sigma-24 [Cupriavidus malaysiensis]